MSTFKQYDISDENKGRLVALRIELFNETVTQLAENLRAGKITLGMFENDMRTRLRLLHTGATAIGAGGWESVTPSDWGRTGAILKEQYGYLHGFAEDIQDRRDTISAKQIAWRARLYGDKAAFTAETTQAGDLRDYLPWLPRDGSTKCLNGCRCNWALSVVGEGEGTKAVRAAWELNPAEHCETCVERRGFVTEFVVPSEMRVPATIGGLWESYKEGPGRGWWGPPRGTHTAQAVPGGTKKTLAERMTTDKARQEVVSLVNSEIEDGAADWGKTTAEMTQDCNATMRNAAKRPVAIQVPSEYLDEILDDGFKNQHELGHSGGAFNPGYRMEAEVTAFDNIPKQGSLGDPKVYPIYGFMDVPGSVTQFYGDVTVILKDSVKPRTTMTAGDSLHNFKHRRVIGTPVLNPGKEGMDREISVLGQMGTAAKAVRELQYFEAQIHGGVSRSDIAAIEVRGIKLVFPDVKMRLDGIRASAERAGIPFREVYAEGFG